MAQTTTTPARQQPGQHPSRVTDADRDAARGELALAFSLAGLTSGTELLCPVHHKAHEGKTLRADSATGRWWCHSAGEGGDGIDLVVTALGLSYPDAIKTLLGRPLSKRAALVVATPLPVITAEPRIRSVLDPQVYAALLAHPGEAGIVAAIEYYGRWHIMDNAVREAGSVRIVDVRAMQRDLTATFGLDRLIACGLVMKHEHGNSCRPDCSRTVFWMCSEDYPVVEPHISPKGEVRGLQFRPYGRRFTQVGAHKAYKGRKAAADAAGVELTEPPIKHVTPFMSLVGIDKEESLIGCGLQHIWTLPPGSVVVIVEGLKDQMAARTMGEFAYAIPGVGVFPSAAVCAILASHTVLVALDGDAAGLTGRDKLIEHLTQHEVSSSPLAMPDGQDVTDILVSRWAATSCSCSTCEHWRASHAIPVPADAPPVASAR